MPDSIPDLVGLPPGLLLPDLSLFVGVRDEVMFVCESRNAASGWRGKGGLIYVVVHRSHGAWTHVYRVVRDHRPGRLAVFVEKVIEGEQGGAACIWARDHFAASGAGDRLADAGPAAELQRLRA